MKVINHLTLLADALSPTNRYKVFQFLQLILFFHSISISLMFRTPVLNLYFSIDSKVTFMFYLGYSSLPQLLRTLFLSLFLMRLILKFYLVMFSLELSLLNDLQSMNLQLGSIITLLWLLPTQGLSSCFLRCNTWTDFDQVFVSLPSEQLGCRYSFQLYLGFSSLVLHFQKQLRLLLYFSSLKSSLIGNQINSLKVFMEGSPLCFLQLSIFLFIDRQSFLAFYSVPNPAQCLNSLQGEQQTFFLSSVYLTSRSKGYNVYVLLISKRTEQAWVYVYLELCVYAELGWFLVL